MVILVRFFNGIPEKLGGWTNWITLSTGDYSNSSVRSIYLYRANDNTRYTGIGTTSRYSIVEGTVPIRYYTCNNFSFWYKSCCKH